MVTLLPDAGTFCAPDIAATVNRRTNFFKFFTASDELFFETSDFSKLLCLLASNSPLFGGKGRTICELVTLPLISKVARDGAEEIGRRPDPDQERVPLARCLE